jgi:Tfp pilus assembly protein PilN
VINTNLSTRPFYNNQAVSFWLLLLLLTVVSATLFNAWRILHYSQSDSALATQASNDAAKAAAARQAAAKLRGSVDSRQVALVSVEAQKANDLIDRRTFSWTDLLNQFEQTLPADVRITSVRPQVKDDRTVRLGVSAVGRSVSDINQFMENLEETQAFAQLLVRDERMTEEGLLEVTLEANYSPKPAAPAPEAAAPPAAASPEAAATASPAAAPPPAPAAVEAPR